MGFTSRETIAFAIAGLSSLDATERSDAGHQLSRAGLLLVAFIQQNWKAGAPDLIKLMDDLNPPDKPYYPTAGIAVLPETFERIRAANGNVPLAEVPPDQDAMEFELHNTWQFGIGLDAVTCRADLDILTSKDPSGGGAIARFLAKHGEGIQQVEFEVSDVDRATQILVEKFGVKAVYPGTRAGANQTRVNFFLLPTGHHNEKVLVEFVEPAKAK